MGTNSRCSILWCSVLVLLLSQEVHVTSDSEVQPEGHQAWIREGPTAYFEVGGSITLECVTTADPPPAYIFWYHNGTRITHLSSFNLRFITEISPLRNTAISILTVKRADLDWQGNYTCFPSNADGTSVMVYAVDDLSLISPVLPTSTPGICEEDINAESGTIQSPNYPEPYGPSESCTWKIIVPEGHRIVLKFDFLDVQSNALCSRDYVSVMDGYGEDNPVLKKVCNNDNYLGTVWSSDNTMTVKFVSDESFQRTGFSATFKTATLCGGDIVADRGVLQSPGDADGFPYICTWNITVPQNNKVVLKIAKDKNQNYGMESFYVYVKDDTGSLTKFFFYLDEERTVRSVSNRMTVIVRSDGWEGLPHFYAEFEKDSCDTVITANSGVVASRQYPNIYLPSENCTWTITVPENYQILLKFHFFELEYQDSCLFDYIEVHDGDSPDSPLLGKLCGRDLPEDLQSTTNKMYVRFVSDRTSEYHGFSAEFKKVPVNG